MMKPFRTELNLNPGFQIRHEQPILTLGSCFAEHIGKRLLDFKWRGLNAPYGTLFHPLALEKLLRMSLDGSTLDPGLFVEHDGSVFHYDLHSRFYGKSPEDLQKIWMNTSELVASYLAQSPLVLITLGTSFVYELQETGEVVANCHKQPAARFRKRLLGLNEIQSSLENIEKLLPAGSRVLCSLSPVRHIRDTLVANSVSKSLLRVALHEWSLESSDRVEYFPAYECVMDDLRDYRFYEEDMIHPNEQAIAYIWDKFTESYVHRETREFMKKWQVVRDCLNHLPQRMDAPSYQTFLRRVLRDLNEWQSIDVIQEIKELEARLI